MAKKNTAAPRGAAPKSPFRKQSADDWIFGGLLPKPGPGLLGKAFPQTFGDKPPITAPAAPKPIASYSKGLASGHYLDNGATAPDTFVPKSLAANPVHPVGGFMARNFPETAAKPLPAFLANHADRQLNWARYMPEALGGAVTAPMGLANANKDLFQSGLRSLWSPVEADTGARISDAPTFSDAAEMQARHTDQGNFYQRNVQSPLWRAAPTLAQASIPGAAVLPPGLSAARKAMTVPSAIAAAKGVGRFGGQMAAWDELGSIADPERGLGGGMVSGMVRRQFDAGPLGETNLKAREAAEDAKLNKAIWENMHPALRKELGPPEGQPAAPGGNQAVPYTTNATTIPAYETSPGSDPHRQVLGTLRGAAEGRIPVEQAQQQLTAHLNQVGTSLPDEDRKIIAPLASGKQLNPQAFQKALGMFAKSPAGQEVASNMAEQGSSSPIQDAFKWFTGAKPWAQGAMIAGLPLALLGIGMSLFGEGGIASMIMSILGVGLMAAGQSGEGGLLHDTMVGRALEPIGQTIGGFLHGAGQKAIGAGQGAMDQAKSWLGGAPAAQPAAQPGAMPATPQQQPVQAMPAAAAIPEGFDPNGDGRISPDEIKALLESPDIIDRVRGLQPAQRQAMLSASIPPDEIAKAKNKLRMAEGANRFANLFGGNAVQIPEAVVEDFKNRGITITPEVAAEIANTLRSM